MKKFITILFVFSSFLLFSQGVINLEMNVFNEFSGEALSFVDVKVVNTTTNQKMSKKTNFNGNVSIDLFPNMDYQIFVSKESDSSIVIFQEKSIKFNTQGVAEGNKIESNVNIRPVFQKGGLQFIQNIEFDIFNYSLDEMDKVILDNVIEILKANPQIQLEVNGFASCNLTTDDANSVSVERATVVFTYLTNAGINYERIKAAAWGKEKNVSKCICVPEKPKDTPCTKSDHLKNSRVNLAFTGM